MAATKVFSKDMRDRYGDQYVGYLNHVGGERISANSYLKLKDKAAKLKNVRFRAVDWLYLEVINGKEYKPAVPMCFRENRLNGADIIYGEFSV